MQIPKVSCKTSQSTSRVRLGICPWQAPRGTSCSSLGTLDLDVSHQIMTLPPLASLPQSPQLPPKSALYNELFTR